MCKLRKTDTVINFFCRKTKVHIHTTSTVVSAHAQCICVMLAAKLRTCTLQIGLMRTVLLGLNKSSLSMKSKAKS